LLPHTTAEVSRILQACHQAGLPVAIQGGLTGLAGGANPRGGELVLSLARLSSIEEIDSLGGTVVVQAGVTLQQLQDRLSPLGWQFPLDLGARASCHLGGNAATNAGGTRVLRFGMMRESILGLEVVLAAGTILTMLNQVIKNNAGPNLNHLFIGAEGTLGVITRLSLKLVPLPQSSCTCLCALPSFQAAATLLREARRHLPALTTFEVMWDGYFTRAAESLSLRRPFAEHHALYALVELLGMDEAGMRSELEGFLGKMMDAGILQDALIPDSLSQAKHLWEIREAASELMPGMRPFIAFDVSVPLSDMGTLVEQLTALLECNHAGKQHHFFGHLGDGNLHLLTGPYPDARQMDEVKRLVYEAVGRVGGSISAETGIGSAKKPYLYLSRSPAEIELMRTLKLTLDPKGILNRGRIVD
jgi:FAD/FMN-containing dehydrogenase